MPRECEFVRDEEQSQETPIRICRCSLALSAVLDVASRT
jgi:hypothetical protein